MPAGADASRAPAGQPGAAGPVRLEPSGAVMVFFRRAEPRGAEDPNVLHRLPDRRGRSHAGVAGRGCSRAERRALEVAGGGSADTTRSEPALSAIALHQDSAATAALLEFASTGTTRMRERALFWIARRAEEKAVATISAAIEHDPDVEVKKQAVFALSQLPRGEGVPLLITLARTNSNPVVRKQAYFWLGQSKDPRALSFFEEVLR